MMCIYIIDKLLCAVSDVIAKLKLKQQKLM